MKRGDLVKHPKGIENVCKEKYSLGIILSEYTPQHPTGAAQVEVLWYGKRSRLVYHSSQLEVISENR